jgi:uncharacterized repeat protein (TIGR02543 family)
MKNYYKILGIPKSATPDQIKQAFRSLSKKYHPDLNPGDNKAAEMFKEINEAHQTLSDPGKRTVYDSDFAMAGEDRPQSASRPSPSGGGGGGSPGAAYGGGAAAAYGGAGAGARPVYVHTQSQPLSARKKTIIAIIAIVSVVIIAGIVAAIIIWGGGGDSSEGETFFNITKMVNGTQTSGGQIKANTDSHDFGVPNVPIGKQFVGWATDAEGSNLVSDASGKLNTRWTATLGSKTIYAIFEDKTYTLNFDLDGGDWAEDSTFKGTDIQLAFSRHIPDSVKKPVKQGYTFDEWYYTASGSKFITMPEGNATVKAGWIKKNYRVVIGRLSDTGEMENNTNETITNGILEEVPFETYIDPISPAISGRSDVQFIYDKTHMNLGGAYPHFKHYTLKGWKIGDTWEAAVEVTQYYRRSGDGYKLVTDGYKWGDFILVKEGIKLFPDYETDEVTVRLYYSFNGGSQTAVADYMNVELPYNSTVEDLKKAAFDYVADLYGDIVEEKVMIRRMNGSEDEEHNMSAKSFRICDFDGMDCSTGVDIVVYFTAASEASE